MKMEIIPSEKISEAKKKMNLIDGCWEESCIYRVYEREPDWNLNIISCF